MNTAPTQELFERDIAEHVATIEHDDGVFRRVKCAKPGTNVYAFNVVTWPGHLCIEGDMGTFVFSRLRDMFGFFRSGDAGGINPSYWEEKCTASDTSGSIRKFDGEVAMRSLRDDCDTWDDRHPQSAKDDFLAAAQAHIDNGCDTRGMYEFLYNYDGDGPPIDVCDFGSGAFESFSSRYVWCCRAIVWAIAQYDALTAPKTEVVA